MITFNIPAAVAVNYLLQDFNLGVFFSVDLSLVILNVLGSLLSVTYQVHVKLYAGLPQTFSYLPSFGESFLSDPVQHYLQVISVHTMSLKTCRIFHPSTRLLLVCFQDVQTGPAVESRAKDSELVEEVEEQKVAGKQPFREVAFNVSYIIAYSCSLHQVIVDMWT